MGWMGWDGTPDASGFASQTLTFGGIVGHALEYEVVSARVERTQGRSD